MGFQKLDQGENVSDQGFKKTGDWGGSKESLKYLGWSKSKKTRRGKRIL